MLNKENGTGEDSGMQKIRQNYNHTLYASYLGYITQAIVNTFIPLLFLTFQSSYQISLDKITSLVTINFGIQLIVDLLSTKWVDRIGYRAAIVAAHICAAAGLAGLGILPELFSDPYWGLLLAVGLYAVGGGLIEVLVSPIVEACPTDQKAAAMSLLHSFYCWGCVLVILVSTLFFSVFGIANWRLLSFLWAAVPLCNALYYSQVPIASLHDAGEAMPVRKLFSSRIFWVFALLMVCAGASEQAMSQWASAFAESGLNVSKTVGDLAGPCMFSILMGISRAMYARYSQRIRLTAFMTGSAVLCIFSYGLASTAASPVLGLAGCGLCGFSVGILWPGAFSLASVSCPRGGTAMFALLALAGDLGCAGGPALVGLIAGASGGNLKAGLAAAGWIPAVLAIGLLKIMYNNRKKQYTQ